MILTELVNRHIKRKNLVKITVAFAAVVFICGCSRNGRSTDVSKETGHSANVSAEEGRTEELSGEDRKRFDEAAEELQKNDADKGKHKPEDVAEENSRLSEELDNDAENSNDPDPDKKTGDIPVENTVNVHTDKDNTRTDNDISILMAGDILLHIPIERGCMLDDGSYDFTPIFANTREDIEAVDLALVNQEVIIGGKELGVSGYPAFNAPFEIGDALVEAGFDVVCHATNHALDRGKTGVVNCLDYWEDKHPEIAVLGLHESEEDRDDIYVFEKNGIKVAVLNYTYGTNGVKIPSDMPYLVGLLKEDIVAEDIRRAEELADFTIVCPHWGTEYNLGISTDQDKWTRIFLENGADLVLGTHPHVIEPIEWVEDEDTGHKMLVYYSIGNYVNWTSGTGPGTSNRMVGGLALVNIGRDESGEAVITDYGVEGIVCHLTKEKGGITVYRISDYDDELARSNGILSQDPDFSKQYCIDLCNKVWGNKWK